MPCRENALSQITLNQNQAIFFSFSHQGSHKSEYSKSGPQTLNVLFGWISFCLFNQLRIVFFFFFSSGFVHFSTDLTEPHRIWQFTRREDRGGGERMDGRMLDKGQVDMEGVGRSLPPQDVCGSQAKEMLQPRKGGYLYLSHSDISCRCWFLWGSNCTFLNGGEV